MDNPANLAPTYEQLTDINNLRRAWQKVATKGKLGGIDRVSVADFAPVAEAEIKDIQELLLAHKYTPEPYMEVKVPKKDNEMRSLGLLTIRDKVVQQTMTDLLTPFFEPRFMDSSYAYRPSRGTAQAVRRVRLCIDRFENRWLVRCDIDRFFDNIPHILLEKQVRYFLKDENLVRLILLCVGMGKVGKAGENWQNSEGKGIPQGGILSPLLANIYLHQLDFHIYQMRRPMGYIRFADDFVLLTREKSQAESVGKQITKFLTDRLGLVLDEYEIKSVEEGFTFLGLRFNTEGVQLDADKQKDILYRHGETLYFDVVEGINPKFKEFVEGVQRYQAQVLAPEALSFLDEKTMTLTIERLKQLKQTHSELTLRQIRYWLEQLPFVTPQYKSQKNRIVVDMMAQIKGVANGQSTVDNGQSVGQKIVPNASNKGKIVDKKATGLKKDKASLEEVLAEKPKPVPAEGAIIPDGINISQDINPQRLIDKKKREYEQREGASMELVITHAGVVLGVAKRQITARVNGTNLLKSPTANVRHISVLSRGVSVSSNLILHCAERNIPIVFYNDDGKPVAKVFSTDDADTALWLAQSDAQRNGKAAIVAREIAEAKVTNQMNVLKYFAKHHKAADTNFSRNLDSTYEFMEKSLKKLQDVDITLPHDKLREQIMAQEGNAAQSYWQQFKELVTDETDFQKREHQGARDLTNMLLNYGYGILYSRIWSAVLNARLHPSVSFLHTHQRGKPTLVFDMVEEFRAPVVDRTVIALINRQEKLSTEQGKLTMDTRKRLAEKVLERLNTTENFRGQRIRLSDIMRLQSVNLAKYLSDENKAYKPYLMKW
jgi:CRISPR-associated endonuclease Cas1/group II intron reverse transcriptase/maturase